MSYLEQFFLIVAVHLLAVASPGPDFAIILKQSIRYGRRTAIVTSFGIATGISLHVTYSLVGIGLIIASDERLFTALKYIAASYFCYVAWHGLRAKKPKDSRNELRVTSSEENIERGELQVSNGKDKNEQIPSAKKAFFTGFLINGLNVKATLFFVSLFSVIIAPETPFFIKLSYGLYMVLATAAWFVFLSYLLTHHRVRYFLQIKGYLLDRVMGGVLLLLAVQLVLSDLS
tara:strand:- start:6825 stop:7517 length:693 start_codon:yes stop_codon:yes gene_type:complete